MAGKPHTGEQAMAALLSKVRTNGACWEWTGATKGNGYGHTSRGLAHRRSYELFIGAIQDGMDVCHTCDNRACINPTHLFVGSRRENMQDALRKGRLSRGPSHNVRRGEASSFAKLGRENVAHIRSSNEPSKVLAARFGVTNDNINRIRRNDTWKDV